MLLYEHNICLISLQQHAFFNKATLFLHSAIFFWVSCFFTRTIHKRANHPFAREMKIMPLRKECEHTLDNSSANMSTKMQDLAEALHQLIQMQQKKSPTTLHLDARLQLPKLSGQRNGEVINSWIWSISMYFWAHPTLTKDQKLQISSLQLDGLTQNWWDTVINNNSIVIDLFDPQDPGLAIMNTWNQLCRGLYDRFDPPDYCKQLMARWLQLPQLSRQAVHAFIEVFCKLWLQLQTSEPEQVLIVKFNFSLLFPIRQEIYMFQSMFLDQAFQRV